VLYLRQLNHQSLIGVSLMHTRLVGFISRSLPVSRTLLLCLLAILAASACSQNDEPTTATASPIANEAEKAPTNTAATSALRALADAVWDSTVADSTYFRLQEGLPIERFEDFTLEQYHADQAKKAGFRADLQQIGPQQLSGDDLITYEILALQLEDNGANDDDFWLRFDITAYIAPYSFQFGKQALAAQQITNTDSAAHYLMLVGELADIIDQLKLKVEGQVERGIYLPKPALPSTRATWEGLNAALPAALVPADARVTALSADQQAELSVALISCSRHWVMNTKHRLQKLWG
jgi:uncharacterized protein (DUF885 family)